MKSSWPDTKEQLDRRESQCGVMLPFPSSSVKVPPPVSTGGSDGCGGDCCRGVRRLLNGTFGISRSGSSGLCGCLQLSANAPTLIVSLRDVLLSSLETIKWVTFNISSLSQDQHLQNNRIFMLTLRSSRMFWSKLLTSTDDHINDLSQMLPWNWLGRTGKNQETHQESQCPAWLNISTVYLPNTSHK